VQNPQKQLAMEALPVFIGLDRRQEFVQVCVPDADGRVVENRRRPNEHRLIAAAPAGRRPAALSLWWGAV